MIAAHDRGARRDRLEHRQRKSFGAVGVAWNGYDIRRPEMVEYFGVRHQAHKRELVRDAELPTERSHLFDFSRSSEVAV